jgi:flagellar protein FliJ
MRKFKFKLEGLLKLRKFKEQMLKAELGEIVGEMNRADEKIKQLSQNIDKGYASQEAVLRTATTGSNIQFYPQYIEAHQANILQQQERKEVLKRDYDEKVKEMAVALGELKIVKNLKEKKLEEFKKDMLKREVMNIDDMVIMRDAIRGEEG